MGLIDADTLKKTIAEEFHGISATGFIRFMRDKTPVEVYNRVRDLIDNAPTVDFERLGESLNCQIRAEYGSCDDCELSCPRNELIKLLDLERTHGEWLTDERGYVCSECGALHSDDYPFCHMCGADMRKRYRLFNPYDHRGITEI